MESILDYTVRFCIYRRPTNMRNHLLGTQHEGDTRVWYTVVLRFSVQRPERTSVMAPLGKAVPPETSS